MSSRKVKENILKTLLWLSAGITIAILIFILGFIFIKGYKIINIRFLTENYSASGNGGILPMIVATLYTIILSIGIATPIGILSAVYLQEYAKQGALVKLIRFSIGF